MIETPVRCTVLDRVDKRVALAFGQAAGDLVEEQHLRPGAERAGELQPLALEQRQLAGQRVRLRHEAGPLQHLETERLGRGQRLARALSGGHERVLKDGHAAKGLRHLELAGDPRRGSGARPRGR